MNSDFADKCVGWFSAFCWCIALGATSWGYGYKHGKQDITVSLEPGTICRIDEDGSRTCSKPFYSEKSPVEMQRLKTYRRRAV